jgi:ketosteroid isomerase-like protein
MRTLALLTFAAAACWAGSENASIKAVEASVSAFNAAAAAGDQATLEKLLHDDLVFDHSNGRRENKAECIAAIVKGKPRYEHSDQKVTIYGATAIVRNKAVAHTATSGVLQLGMIQVWVKSGKGWQMVSRHTVRLPAS